MIFITAGDRDKTGVGARRDRLCLMGAFDPNDAGAREGEQAETENLFAPTKRRLCGRGHRAERTVALSD